MFFRRRNNTISIINLIFSNIVKIDLTFDSNIIENDNYLNFDFNRQQYKILQIFIVDVIINT